MPQTTSPCTKLIHTLATCREHPLLRKAAVVAALLLVVAAVHAPASTLIHARFRSLYIFILGVVVIVMTGSASHSWAYSFTLVVVAICMTSMIHHSSAQGVATHHKDRGPAGAGAGVATLEEGFAVASDRVRKRLHQQQSATTKLHQSMKGAQINAAAIQQAMKRFHNIRSRKSEFRERMTNVRKNIDALRESYAVTDDEQKKSGY